jgi:sugar O-acyltransferase (sialic acid O-acetyltransferase NeuD family)
MKPLLIFAAGGFAREVAWLAECTGEWRVTAFVDDNPALHGQVLNGIPVISPVQALQHHAGSAFVVAIGAPAVRARVAARLLAQGFAPATLVDPGVRLSRFVEVGEGTVICAASTLTTNIRLGRQVQINLDCTVGHDVVMHDYATLAPGAHVSGWVVLEEGAYVGTGAVIINGTADAPLIIGAGSVVGAGACVTRSLPAGITAVGIPARPLERKS